MRNRPSPAENDHAPVPQIEIIAIAVKKHVCLVAYYSTSKGQYLLYKRVK